jgi:hypothetical protein
MRDPKQMEPKEVVAERAKLLETTLLLFPEYHQSAKTPAAEQKSKFLKTRDPQKKEMRSPNKIMGLMEVLSTLISAQVPAVVRESRPLEQAQLAPAVAHSDIRKVVPPMITTSAPLEIATPYVASCQQRAQAIWTRVRKKARTKMEGYCMAAVAEHLRFLAAKGMRERTQYQYMP